MNQVAERFTPGLLKRIPPPRKVVLLRASRIGDFLCATPAFRALRAALPDAHIALIALPMMQALVARNTALDRFISFCGWPGIAEQFYRPREARALLSRLRAERFDLAIQMHGSGVFANPFLRAIRARFNAGFIREGDSGVGLDAALPLPGGDERECLLGFVRFLGVLFDAYEAEFPLWPEDHAAAAALLAGARRPLIGVHADARDAARRWPMERFVAAGQMLADARHGTMVLVGGRSGDALARRDAIDVRGRTSLPVLGAVLAQLSVLLTNDSGPAHIAYALRVPSVTVFGATDPARWGPVPGPHLAVSRDIGCRPCGAGDCPHGSNACLDAVTIEEVGEAALAVMREDARSGHEG